MKIKGIIRGSGKHRAERQPIYWLWEYRALRNRWWFFWKPGLKRKLKGIFGE